MCAACTDHVLSSDPFFDSGEAVQVVRVVLFDDANVDLVYECLVRLTAKLSGKENIVHASVGSCVDILLHERDRRFELDWQDSQHVLRHRGVVYLQASLEGVFVKFVDYRGVSMGLGEGVLLVERHVSYWKYKIHEYLRWKRKQAEVSIARRQIPLAPPAVCIVHTVQGMSMGAALICMAKPGNMDDHDYWMHLYVMISRVRRGDGLLAIDVPPVRAFERGRLPWVIEGIERLEL